jgi:hypothetical protein
MTLERFCSLIEAWGGEIGRWPEHERIAAWQFAETTEGTEALARARTFDRLLSASAPHIRAERAAIASFAVIQRIAAENGRQSHRSFSLKWLFPGASLACSVAVGVSLALSVPFERHPHEQQMFLSLILDYPSLPMAR